ncbi:hypothetical protein DXC09_09255 [Streptococcus vestibularis]|nr:hypothetical protein DXC09_09255 [Streptococcus vestibularis]
MFHLLVSIERQNRLDTLPNLIIYLIKQYQLNDVKLSLSCMRAMFPIDYQNFIVINANTSIIVANCGLSTLEGLPSSLPLSLFCT